nr:cellulose synthase-like protein H1 [Ipomoea trifida]
MAAKHPPFPLYEIKYRNNRISRAIEIIILFLLLSLITYRLFSLGSHDGIPWLLALICEAWFTFVWVLTVNAKWNQIQTKTYPQRLLQRLGNGTSEFPAVDLFVTTADPELEPPIITVNTVLSLLAVDYPAKKLACYVSDDGASPLTFYSLVQASNFAKLWVPFCRKYNVAVRAPFRYFNANPIFPQDSSLDFQHEWKKMKDEYSKLCRKIEEASEESVSHELIDEFSVFANIDRRHHPTIIKVIWENKGSVDNGDGVPHLVYISREKRPKHPHHYKAGALNVLTRVSGVMTNAPFMLNVDCDFYVNDSKIILHAMCFFLGVKDEKDVGFVQFPQSFYGGLKNDPYGNQLKISIEESLEFKDHFIWELDVSIEERLYMACGHTWSTVMIPIFPNSLEDAKEVASCGYESGTAWGQKVGLLYGSAAEDTKTGISIHGKGWKSAYCDPNPPGFLGSAPTSGPAALTQQKRWATGLLEILICKKSPIIWETPLQAILGLSMDYELAHSALF